MQVKEGYKQTGIGVIPEDWNIRTISAVGEVIRGASPRPQGDPRFYGGNVPRLMVEDITRDGHWVSPKVDFLTEAGAKLSRKCKPGTLTIICSGTPSAVGLPSRLFIEACIHDGILAIQKPSTSICVDYLYHLLRSQQEELHAAATHGGTFVNLTTDALKGFKIPLPPTKAEQEAIAGALSDTDAWIESLEQLIAKKRRIKEGSMQALLTAPPSQMDNGQLTMENASHATPKNNSQLSTVHPPFTRLPGFSGDWEVKTLGDIASLYQPETISASKFTESGYPVYGANGIVGLFDKTNHTTWQVTVTCRGSTCGTVNRTVDQCWITGNAMVLNCDHNQSLEKEFFYYALLSTDLSDCITGTGQPQIVRTPLANTSIKLPPTKPEQTAIAEVLSEMDAEIDALEGKLAKARQIKQGMMQELLTGKTRLV